MPRIADWLVIPAVNDALIESCLPSLAGATGVLLARRGMSRDVLTRCRTSGWTLLQTDRLNFTAKECSPILARHRFARVIVFCRDVKGDLTRYDNILKFVLGLSPYLVFVDPQGGQLVRSARRAAVSFHLRRLRPAMRRAGVFFLFAITAAPLLALAPLLRLRTALRFRFRSYRLLVTGRDISNQPARLTRYLLTRGIRAESLLLSVHPYSCEPCDRMEDLERIPGGRRYLRLAWHYLRAMVLYDVIFFLYGYESFLAKPVWTNWELPRLAQRMELVLDRLLGKKIIFLFRDCKLRRRAIQSKREPLGGCRDCLPSYESRYCDSDEVIERTAMACHAADAVLVSTPDLLLDAPAAARWLPNAVDSFTAERSVSAVSPPDRPLIILHSSTYPAIKRTAILERVVERLQRQYSITLKILKGVSHREFMEWVDRCDIAVDQFAHGAHGHFAIECMAAGKPVVGWVIRDLYPAHLPIMAPDIENLEVELEQILDDLIRNPELRRTTGAQGRAYVREMHDVDRVGERLLDVLAGLRPPVLPMA
jgi:glycosyltransferase involved in cell wall biosynthesis